MSATVSLAPVVAPVLQFSGLVLAGVLTAAAHKLVGVLQNRFHLQLTAQQVETVHDAAATAAGVLDTMLARGAMKVEDVHVENPQVLAVVQQAMTAVPQAATALGVTPQNMAHMVVSRVNRWGFAPAQAHDVPADSVAK